jgi:hypothetical protein
MTSIIINMVSDADMWPAKIALPYRFTGVYECHTFA